MTSAFGVDHGEISKGIGADTHGRLVELKAKLNPKSKYGPETESGPKLGLPKGVKNHPEYNRGARNRIDGKKSKPPKIQGKYGNRGHAYDDGYRQAGY